MSILLLLSNILPYDVLKIISNYCGKTELNILIENFNKQNLKNTRINKYVDVKLCDIYINGKSYIFYRNILFCFSTPYLKTMFSENNNILNVTIGANTLNSNINNNMHEFVKYINLIENSDFYHFMLKFEIIMYDKIIKHSDFLEFTFIPFIKLKNIFKFNEDLNEFDKKNIIGYCYNINIIITSKTIYYKENPITNNFDKITHQNINKWISTTASFILMPILNINKEQKKIFIEIIAIQIIV